MFLELWGALPSSGVFVLTLGGTEWTNWISRGSKIFSPLIGKIFRNLWYFPVALSLLSLLPFPLQDAVWSVYLLIYLSIYWSSIWAYQFNSSIPPLTTALWGDNNNNLRAAGLKGTMWIIKPKPCQGGNRTPISLARCLNYWAEKHWPGADCPENLMAMWNVTGLAYSWPNIFFAAHHTGLQYL